jgi:hypothetical protein
MDVGPPPEFGEDGSPPPITAAPVEIARWDLNKSVSQFLPELQDAASTNLSNLQLLALVAIQPSFLLPAIGAILGSRRRHDANVHDANVRASDMSDLKNWPVYAKYDHFWQRKDPVTQLPPGGSDTVTISLRVGISKERTDEIARSLGITGGDNHILSVSNQLSEKSATKIALSQEREASRSVTLTNSEKETYRRLAIWHVVHRLSIMASPISASDKAIVLQETEFVLSDATNVTFVDVRRAGGK